MGGFMDKQNKDKSLGFYNTSLKKQLLTIFIASNYRNIANMYFRTAAYPVAAKYYDSTVNLILKVEIIHIQKVRKDLDEVILHEAVASRNDSIFTRCSMSEVARVSYFENY
jgi:hypothetical protein